MDGNRSLAIGAVIGLSAVIAACTGGGAAPAPSGTPAPNRAITKVGGNPTSTLKATLGTVQGQGYTELNFTDSVKELSTGTIDIAIADHWRSGDPDSEAGLVNDVAAGKAELGMIPARGFDTVGVNNFAGLQAPMLIDSYALEAKVLATDWATKLLEGPRSVGIVGLGYVQGELRRPLGITRDLAQMSDFQGARIGIRPSHMTDITMKALGATSSHLALPWNISGVDGLEMGAPGIAGNGFYNGATSLTGNLVFWPRPDVIFANAKWFDSLSTEQRGQLRAAVAEADQLAVTSLPVQERDARNQFCAAGFSIKSASSQALDAFRQALQPVTDEMAKDQATKAIIDAIVALRGPSDAPDVVAPCPKTVPSPSPSSGPTALDGTWKTSFTKADLVSSPLLMDNGEINDGNWGDMTLTFDHGKFISTQSNNITHGTSSGPFTVTGDVVTFHNDQTGETFVYRWSIFKNTLSFKRDATLGVAPTPSLIKPWTRVR